MSHPIQELAAADYDQLTATGINVLWVAFGGLFAPCLYFFYAAMQQPDGKRFYHILSFLINAIASTAYMAMATGYGSVFVYGSDDKYRQFFYARYIDWSLTTPLMLLDLAGLANASFDTTFFLLSTDFLMIVTGLVGALIGSTDHVSWGFWIFGMFAFIPIVYFLWVGLPAPTCDAASAALFKKAAMVTVVFWSFYPLVWILAEGTSTIDSDTEVILYTILDVIAKSGFGFIICNGREALDAAERGTKISEMTPQASA